jgi:nucleotide-binding universal stress UspA family protein
MHIKAGLLAVCRLRSFTAGNVEHGEFNMYRHILIPTDGSELSQKALEHGLAMARAINANVTVLTVSAPFHMLAFEPGMVTDTQDQYEQHVAAHAAKYLAAAKQAASAANVSCETVRVENEHPYQTIIDAAAQRGCDLIVMASHGRRGISAVVLGSETVKVLTHSAVPVLVIRPTMAAASLSQPKALARAAA